MRGSTPIDKQRQIYRVGLIFFSVILVGGAFQIVLPRPSDTSSGISSILFLGLALGATIIGVARLTYRATTQRLQRTLALILSLLFAFLTFAFVVQLATTPTDAQIGALVLSAGTAILSALLFAVALGFRVDAAINRWRARLHK